MPLLINHFVIGTTTLIFQIRLNSFYPCCCDGRFCLWLYNYNFQKFVGVIVWDCVRFQSHLISHVITYMFLKLYKKKTLFLRYCRKINKNKKFKKLSIKLISCLNNIWDIIVILKWLKFMQVLGVLFEWIHKCYEPKA